MLSELVPHMAGVVDERFLKLVQFEARRAREYYEMARPLLPLLDPSSRPCLAAMYGIYGGILDRIERQGYTVVVDSVIDEG